jgi:hypothetical protein
MAKFARDTLKVQTRRHPLLRLLPPKRRLGEIFSRTLHPARPPSSPPSKNTATATKISAPSSPPSKPPAPTLSSCPATTPKPRSSRKQARELGLAMPLLGIDGWESSRAHRHRWRRGRGRLPVSTHYSAESKSARRASPSMSASAKRWGEDSNALSALGYDAAMLAIDAIKPRRHHRRREAPRRPRRDDQLLPAATGRITFDTKRNPTKSAVVLTVASSPSSKT